MKYEEYYKQMHEKGMFKAWTSERDTNYTDKDLNRIFGAVAVTDSKTILDFGCGKGDQYTKGKVHKKIGIRSLDNVLLYDPGVPEYANRPNKIVDATISFDVFEHIPREELPETFEYIFAHTKKFCYFVIHCGLAAKTLPSGENAHCTIMSQKSWQLFISQFNKQNIPILYSFKIPLNPKFNILNL